jgi:hypothetical protein
MNQKLPSTPLTDLEQSIAKRYCAANFPPATAAKAFARNLEAGYVKELSSRGRHFLAYCVHRYRRQYVLTSEEAQWVNEWLSWQDHPQAAPKSAKPSGPLKAPTRIQVKIEDGRWIDLIAGDKLSQCSKYGAEWSM